MVATKQDANRLISEMPEQQFSILCAIMNKLFVENTEIDKKRTAAVNEFLNRMKDAEEAVSRGEFVTASELRAYLGV